MRYSNHSNYRPARTRTIKSFDPTFVVKKSAGIAAETVVPYAAQNRFGDLGLTGVLVQNISTKGYTEMTPIQDQTIPLLLSGKDVVGIANTGTGKTAAFLIPLIQKAVEDRSNRVLIVTPTRELAVQIEQELRQLSRQMGLWSALCIGGTPMGKQLFDLRRNPNFVVGTPGRLKDLEERKAIRFSAYTAIVLDEVDRMLDMGFIHDVTHIVSRLAPVRQSAFFSATTAGNVARVMQQFLKNPITVSVKTNDTMSNVAQEIVRTRGKVKVEVLHDLLIQRGFDKVLVFGRTKHGLEKLATDLTKRGFEVATIHGNKSQGQRQRSLEQFKNNRVKVLLATDVASRGLDIRNVTHVINYDLPESYEDYIHRIGRTGRANNKGIALTLVD